ncbi:MAG TPA: cytochrome b N-terminal domain-containing protein [Candidatus Bathyarchaeia archaeon]|nr:cytochrome b N-terminal domain-containing protein [Candidatus Bathyarchaeia archaeon]
MATQRSQAESKSPVQLLIDWLNQRLERTIFLGLKFTLPKKFVSPLGFLGFLTFTTFAILGISGALLMLYYSPYVFFNTVTGAVQSPYDSVQLINNVYPFGSVLRNIHYHASNAMVLLATAHMFYQYFSGRYKLRYEVLWVTGIIIGILTIIEAYTGYDLVLNVRGMLAINIGRALARSTPFMGPMAFRLMAGTGLSDLILRFYSVHVFIFPMLMILIMMVHFPRYLVLDIPVVSMVSGVILVTGGLFPVELGAKFIPTAQAGITMPEWYLTGMYAIIRTGIDKFVAGAVIPLIFVIVFLVVPFLDTSRKLTIRDRPFYTAMGLAGLGQLALTTVWGFRANDIFQALNSIPQLEINPYIFFGSVVFIGAVAYGGTYVYFKSTAPPPGARPTHGRKQFPIYKLTANEWRAVVISLLGFQVLFDIYSAQAFFSGFKNVVLLQIGIGLIAFGILAHLYRIGAE